MKQALRTARGAWPNSCGRKPRSHRIGTMNILPRMGNEKTGRDGDSAEPNLAVDRRIKLPKNFGGKSVHEIWGLVLRLSDEHKSGRSAPLPLSNDELAVLVQLYDDEPSPALRQVVIRELRNQRRKRPGRKADHDEYHGFDWDLLPLIYDRGMCVARRYRKRLSTLQKRKKRRDPEIKIPTQSKVALRYVRKRLQYIAGLSDKTLMNKLSAMKDPRDKRRMAKSAER